MIRRIFWNPLSGFWSSTFLVFLRLFLVLDALLGVYPPAFGSARDSIEGGAMALIYVAVLDDGTSSLALRHPSRAVSQFLSSGGGESCAAVHCFLVAHLIDGTDCCGLAANQVRSSDRLGFDTRVSGNYLHRFFRWNF